MEKNEEQKSSRAEDTNVNGAQNVSNGYAEARRLDLSDDVSGNVEGEDDYVRPTDGRVVIYTPSDRTRARKFMTAREGKKTFPAVVTDVNENSVDLTVFSTDGTTIKATVPHKSQAGDGRSSWDWPKIN